MYENDVNKLYIWLICLTAACGGLLFGYDWVVIGGAKPFYEIYFDITSPTISGFVMGAALIGCILGAMAAGALADAFGRKKPLIAAALLFVISALGSAIADNLSAFVIYRVIGGIGIGLASTISPMYIAEVSPAASRGKMVAINQLTIVIGILAAQIVNLMIAQPVPEGFSNTDILQSWNGQTGWRMMFGAELAPAILFLVCMCFVPESPRWLLKADYNQRALTVLKRIGSQRYAVQMNREIQHSLLSTPAEPATEVLASRALRPVLIIGVVLAVFQQWCGINVVFNYAQEVFASAGFDINDTLRSIVATGLINLLFTLLALPLVDKLGRRSLMLIGSGGLAVVYGLIALAYALGILGLPVLVLVLCAIAIYATTLAPVTWVLLSELFPTRVRGLAMSVATFTLWIAAFVLTLTFPLINAKLGAAGSFSIYALICVAGWLFVVKRVPETKGLSLEQVEQLLAAKA